MEKTLSVISDNKGLIFCRIHEVSSQLFCHKIPVTLRNFRTGRENQFPRTERIHLQFQIEKSNLYFTDDKLRPVFRALLYFQLEGETILNKTITQLGVNKTALLQIETLQGRKRTQESGFSSVLPNLDLSNPHVKFQ